MYGVDWAIISNPSEVFLTMKDRFPVDESEMSGNSSVGLEIIGLPATENSNFDPFRRFFTASKRYRDPESY